MSFSAYLFCTMFLDGDEVSRNSASGESDVSESENDVIGTAGEAKLAEEYNYDDVTAQKKAPAGRKQYFVRIGKSADGNELETADEYIDRPEKKIPPGALAPPSKKGRVKFVRIGRRQRFVRIGKNSETASSASKAKQEDNGIADETGLDRTAQTSRKRHFVSTGQSPNDSDLKTAGEYTDRLEKKIPPGALAPPSKKGRVKFVRIGRRQRFVRIGRKPESFDGNGEPQSESNADSTDEQELRSFEQIRKRSGRLRFVRIGRNTGA